MPRERDDAQTMLDIQHAAALISSYLNGIDQVQFERSTEKQDSVLLRLIVIGEAVSRLTPAFKERHPAVPWRQIKDMRNFLVHDYDRISAIIAWRAASADVPELIRLLGEAERER